MLFQLKNLFLIVFYNILQIGCLLLLSPLLIFILLKPKYRFGFFQKLGLNLAFLKNKAGAYTQFHGVSVGEINAALPFIMKFKSIYPQQKIIITTTTRTGYQNAKDRFSDIDVIYYPFDFLISIILFFKKYPVREVFILETEIWPNFLFIANLLKKRLVLLNARLSDKSFPKYKRLSFIFSPLLNSFDFIFTQSQLDMERFRQIGLSEKNLFNTGSMKFDSAVLMQLNEEKKNYGSDLLSEVRSRYDNIIVAGSIQEVEFIPLFEQFIKIKEKIASICLVLCPRKPEQLPLFLNYLHKLNYGYELKSKGSFNCESDLFIIDSFGDLMNCYKSATISIIGKSFIEPGGAQNPLEAAIWGKPVIIGSYFQNFSTIVGEMKNKKAILCLKNLDEIHIELSSLLSNHDQRSLMGRRAREFVFSEAGTCNKILDMIKLDHRFLFNSKK